MIVYKLTSIAKVKSAVKSVTVSFNRVLSLGSTMPRKKKKAFKKRILSI